MARFTVQLSTDNLAFEDDPGYELARILRGIADDISNGREYDMFQTIFDANGNDVGRYALKPESYYA